MSGSRCGVSGVGTQMRIASGSESRSKSAVASEPAGRPGRFQTLLVQMLDVARCRARSASIFDRIDVEAEDPEALLGERQGQRQARRSPCR